MRSLSLILLISSLYLLISGCIAPGGENGGISFTIPNGWSKSDGFTSSSQKTMIGISHGSNQAHVMVNETLNTANKHSDKIDRLEHITSGLASNFEQSGNLIDWRMTSFAGKHVGEIIFEMENSLYAGGRERTRLLLYDPGLSNNLVFIYFAYMPEVITEIQDDFDAMERSWKWES